MAGYGFTIIISFIHTGFSIVLHKKYCIHINLREIKKFSISVHGNQFTCKMDGAEHFA